MVDSLWLTDERMFILGSQDQLSLKYLVRKIFKIGCYNLQQLVSDWKDWGNNLFHDLAETVTIGGRTVPRHGNPFWKLEALSLIRDMRQGKMNRLLIFQHLSHLISSRQMPYMGLKTELKARKQFKEVITSTDLASPSHVEKMRLAAGRIGRICKALQKRPIGDGPWHISVTSSGEYNHSIKNGAQVGAVRDAMLRVLNRIPVEDEYESTPFGPVFLKEGIPIWRSLFRLESPWDEEDEIFFDFPNPQLLTRKDLGDPGPLEFKPGSYWGIDDYLGKQLMYVAWKETGLVPIPARTEVVPELGNKARHITMSAYWLNILQAPLSHALIDALKCHPSVYSSFHRQDQAWEASRGLIKLPIKDDYWMLSSDLKDATNAQQFELTKVMLKSFMENFGLLPRESPYKDLVLDTIGPREIHFSDGSIVTTTKGIMMGEAIAKPSLTLLNLAIEELSFLQSIGREDLLCEDRAAPDRDWRFCHIGGDDHIAYGPCNYLDLITDNHLQSGSHISPGQHGRSRVCVRYTERLILVENLKNRVILGGDDNYDKSLIVDSIKVRLLERGQSTQIKKDNKNVAIGKSKQLAGALKWIRRVPGFWSYEKLVSIRDLFINRMGCLLPSKTIHPKVYSHILLPSSIGGLDLGFEEEIPAAIAASPEPTKWLLSKILSGHIDYDDLRLFRKLNTNTSTRGVPEITEFQQILESNFRENILMRFHKTWQEIKQEFPDDNPKKVNELAEKAGWLTIEEFCKRATRGNLFQKLLTEVVKPKVFKTKVFARTYNHIWNECESLGMNHYYDPSQDLAIKDGSQIINMIREALPVYYLDSNQDAIPLYDRSGFPIDRDSYEYCYAIKVGLLEAFEGDTPTLKLGYDFLTGMS